MAEDTETAVTRLFCDHKGNLGWQFVSGDPPLAHCLKCGAKKRASCVIWGCERIAVVLSGPPGNDVAYCKAHAE